MYKINALNNISDKGLAYLNDNYSVVDNTEDVDAILVRSFKMHDMELPESLVAIGRAGAGVNNIPVDKCSEEGIVVFNTPGANANAVKELVLAGLLLSSRKIYRAMEWAQTLEGADVPKIVEKGKSNFAGAEIKGKKLGVIGLGAIGVMVANAAASLGMEVIGHDPYLSVDSAWQLSRAVQKCNELDKLLSECDYLTIHVPLLDDTKHMINKEKLAIMKKGVKILNFSRGGLVNDDDIIEAVKEGIVDRYVTDFPNDKLIGIENIVCIPHLGASTAESEENCAVMAVNEIMDYLENGNITNSVNYPNSNMGALTTGCRVTLNHKNVPAMVGKITNIMADKNINITDMNNRSRGEWAYTVIDIEKCIDDDTVELLENIDGVVKVRVLKK